MDIDTVRQEYDKLKSALTVTVPFISSLLSRVRIILNDAIVTAGVNDRGVMVIAPSFWSKLSWAGKAWILAHECLHIAFRDHRRRWNRSPIAWNFVCDAVNNELIKDFLKLPDELCDSMVFQSRLWDTLRSVIDISFDDFIKLSKEEIYRLLPKCRDGDSGKLTCPRCGSEKVRITTLYIGNPIAHLKCENCGFEWDMPVDLSGGGGKPIPIDYIVEDLNRDVEDGDVLQDGDPEIYKDGRESDGEEVDEKWKDRIARAYDLQKSIGRVPLGLKRIVDDLLKSKVDWRSLLRQAFKIGFGRTVISTWMRPSRKYADYPGLRRLTYPTVWCLVDCSGSISEVELEQFIGEIYEIAGDATVTVVVWDTRVYDVIEARSRMEVISNVKNRLRGYGGTEICPALKTTLERMKNKDIVVILSDMQIYDMKEDETVKAFSEIASKASVAVICSTDREVDIEGWRFIKLEVNNR